MEKKKGNGYLKNGMKIIKTLYKLKEINEDFEKTSLSGKRQQAARLKNAKEALKKEIGKMRNELKEMENADIARESKLLKMFSTHKLSELEKRMCFYLMVQTFDGFNSWRGNDLEAKTVMNVICADGIADPVDTLCDYMLFEKLKKISLFEIGNDGRGDGKLFERTINPSSVLLEAAVGSLMNDSSAPRHKKRKELAMAVLGNTKGVRIRKSKYCLDHVVLPPELRKKIDDFIWFYQKKDKSGWDLKELGLSTGNALFYGPPGTGKTLLAEAIAGELKLEIAKVKYEEIVDCWVGNSEKSIKRVFDSNRAEHKVILFDECDALLESRGDARDSVDRMNNRMINIILQELEAYPGIVIFTTNRAVQLDQALDRRILLKMEIPRPGKSEREKIWKKMTTGKIPLADEIEWVRIADIDLSGGEIKNAILNLAKDPEVNRPKVKISTEHLLMAAKNEIEGRISSEKKGRMGFITS